MRYLSALVMLAVSLAAAVSLHAQLAQAGMMTLPQCHPSLLQSGTDRIRKVCAALSTIYELSNAMESYLDDKGTLQMLRENAPLVDSGVKRQDVDHVFLRFGRRR